MEARSLESVLEDKVSAFIQLKQEIEERVWLQAALLHEVKVDHGPSAVEEFCKMVGISLSWGYKLLKLHYTFGDEETRIENLSPSAHIAAAEAAKGNRERAREIAEDAADNSKTKARIYAENRPEREPERELEAGGTDMEEKPVPLHPVEAVRTCPVCGDGAIPEHIYHRLAKMGLA